MSLPPKSTRLPKAWWMLLLCLPWFINCNCDPTDIGSVSELLATPKSVNYSATEGEKETKSVILQAKLGSVIINSITLEKGAPHYVIDKSTLPTLPATLKAGETITLKVTYTAPAGEAQSGQIRVESDASTPSDGVLNISLLAQVNQQQLVFDPEPVNFGKVKQGESKEIEVVGKNEGRAILTINELKWDETSSKGFTFPNGLPKTPITLKPGESFKFKAKYEPTSSKLDEGKLLVTCDGKCAPAALDPEKRKDPYTLRFIGQVSAPIIEVKPLTINFGNIENGKEKTEKVKISNLGSATLTVTKISMKAKSSGAFIVARLVDVTIAPGSSRELPVTFRPTSGSNHEGTIEIHNNDNNKPLVEVKLFGKVSGPDINVSPKTLDFGAVNTPKQLAFTISNTGVRPLEIQNIEMMVGTSGEFTFVKLPTFPLTVLPNQFQAVQVLYTPKNKSKDTGKVLITSNDPDEGKVEVILTAEGSLLPQCDLVGTPTIVNFGIGVLGKTKIVPVKWENQGDKDCTISSFTVGTDRTGFPPYSGPDVFHLPNAPTGCVAGSGKYVCNPPLIVKTKNTLTVNVGFTPVTEKKATPFSSATFTGYLEASTDGTPANRRVQLQGEGKAPCLVAAPETLDFGLVTTGCNSQKQKVTLYNICSQDVTITKIGFSSSGANGFRILSAAKTPFTIKASQSSDIELAFKAAAPPARASAVLNIENDLTHQNPLSIPMVGEGTSTAEQTDTFKQTKNGKTDILFIIDNSGSMGGEQKNLSDNFKSFINWASTLQVDFQIGITTTSVKSNPLSATKAGEFVGNTPILTRNTPNYATAFRQQALVGTGGSASEMGLEAMRLALSAPNITTGKNKGFLRKDATLSIVTVSDEQDSSALPVQAYINFLLQLKGPRNKDLIRYNIVIGIDEKTLANKCPNGQAQSAGRYLAVAQAFRGVIASICNSNWSGTLSRIGSVTFGLKSTFFLTRPADPTSIEVKVDGKPVATGASTWTYNANDNSIEFKTAPPAGSTIQVRYKAICF